MLDSLALPIMNRAKPSEEAEAMERLTMDEPGGKGMTFLSSCTRGGARLFFGAPPHAPPSYRGVSRRRGETATMEGGVNNDKMEFLLYYYYLLSFECSEKGWSCR